MIDDERALRERCLEMALALSDGDASPDWVLDTALAFWSFINRSDPPNLDEPKG
jgi:hypothetical protein